MSDDIMYQNDGICETIRICIAYASCARYIKPNLQAVMIRQ
jgi:hypothetical protein